MEKPFEIRPLDATFGAIVTGLRLAELDEHAFAKRFGPLELERVPLNNIAGDLEAEIAEHAP
jgi:hypothetical protein